MEKTKPLFAAILWLFWAPSAQAQYTPLINPLTRTTIPQVIQCPGCNKARSQVPDQPQTPLAEDDGINLSYLRFSFDPALRKSITAQFAKTIGDGDAKSPAGRYVSSGAALGDMQRRMTGLGLTANDIGDTFALFLASHWSLARGQATLPPRHVMQAVKTQMAAILIAQPTTAELSNAAKQQQADSMMILAAVSMREIVNANKDPKAMATIAASATRLLKGMGFDPAQFELTTQGIVPVKLEE